MHAVLGLAATLLFGVAGLYFHLSSPFLAMMQIHSYVGARVYHRCPWGHAKRTLISWQQRAPDGRESAVGYSPLFRPVLSLFVAAIAPNREVCCGDREGGRYVNRGLSVRACYYSTAWPSVVSVHANSYS